MPCCLPSCMFLQSLWEAFFSLTRQWTDESLSWEQLLTRQQAGAAGRISPCILPALVLCSPLSPPGAATTISSASTGSVGCLPWPTGLCWARGRSSL